MTNSVPPSPPPFGSLIRNLIYLIILAIILYIIWFLVGMFVHGTILMLIGVVLALILLAYACRLFGLF
jgi:hypothetical protein